MESGGKLINGKYRKVSLLGEGSGGKVYLVERMGSHPDTANENSINPNIQIAASQKAPRVYFALKKLKHYGKAPASVDHQITLLSTLSHPNIIKFEEVFTVDKGYKTNTYVLMEHCIGVLDLFTFKQVSPSEAQLKQILWQLVSAIQYLHNNGYVHRDIKPSNVLIGRDGVVRLADFDIATQVKPEMTKNMTTRYYRPPEIIFGSNTYSYEVDIWSLGCTICELVLQHPLFPGTTDIDQLQKIFNVMGSPSKHWPAAQNYPFYLNFQVEDEKGLENILPVQNPDLLDLVKKMVVLDPQKRIAIKEVKQHPYFSEVETDLAELSKLSSYVHSKKIKQMTK